MNNFKFVVIRKLKPYARYIPEISKPTLRSMVKLCIAFIEQQKFSKDAFDREVTKLRVARPDGPDDYDIYCTIIMILIETFLKSKKSDEELAGALKELKFQDECIEDLTKVLVTNHQSLREQFEKLKSLEQNKLEYRIDISLIDSGQQPSVILHQNQNGELKTINFSLKQFHRARLATASALAEVLSLEGKKS